MTMLHKHTVIIIDDHQPAIDVLQKDLSLYEDIHVIATCTSIPKAKEMILNFRPAILFIDVEMPKMSGLDLIEELESAINWPLLVVIYSAFAKYSIQAIRLNVFDFLLKPYQQSELDEIICRLRIKIDERDDTHQRSSYVDNNHKIAIQSVSGIYLLNKNDVLFFRYEANLWHVYLTDTRKYTLRSSINCSAIVRLSDSYVLVNPQHIVNLNHVAMIENKTLFCQFYAPYDTQITHEIIISRRNYPKIKTLLCLI